MESLLFLAFFLTSVYCLSSPQEDPVEESRTPWRNLRTEGANSTLTPSLFPSGRGELGLNARYLLLEGLGCLEELQRADPGHQALADPRQEILI